MMHPALVNSSFSPAEYFARHDGIVSPALRSKRALAAGCSGASYTIEMLARCGLNFALCDFDTVSPANLIRTAFGVEDVGALKAEALGRRIRACNPFATIDVYPVDVLTYDPETWAERLRGVDLLMAGTDSFEAQARLNEVSQRFAIPAVFTGFHPGAQGGRIVYSIPGVTACYRCVAADRYEAGSGTDLPATPGCLIDTQFIDMVSAKICLGLLERGQETAMGRFGDHLGARNEVIVRASPEYEYGNLLWDAALADLPAGERDYAAELKTEVLFAMDTVWLRGERVIGCPDCALYGAGVRA